MLDFEPLLFVVIWCAVWRYLMPSLRAYVLIVGGGYAVIWSVCALLVAFWG